MKGNLTMNESVKQRNSGIELLKIIAIIMIVVSHSMPAYGAKPLIVLSEATENIQQIATVIIRYFGQVGNVIFVVCSSWFLIESKRSHGGGKILVIICDCFVISVVWLIITVLLGYNVTKMEIIKQFFPVTMGNNWFIGCYILFYAIHPLLNKIIDSITKETHLKINVIIFLLYSIINVVIGNAFYYNSLIGFIAIYFFTAYIKLYLPKTASNTKINIFMLVFGILGSVALLITANYLGLHITFLSDKVTHWVNFMNPLCLLWAFGLFNIFKEKNFVNKFVNYISGLSLLIYLIHENYFVYTYIRNDIFRIIKCNNLFDNLIIWIFIYASATMITSVICAAVYKMTFQKIIKRICGVLIKAISSIYVSFSKIILDIE